MSARDDILNFKHRIPEMQKNSALSAAVLADALFENFLGYASEHWHYAAQPGSLRVDALLSSATGQQVVACGTLRDALKTMLREDLGRTDVKDANINEYFITKPDLKCFDPLVKGNLGNRGSNTFNLGCHFSTHFFLSCGGKYYDPCLSTTYRTEREPILQTTSKLGTLHAGVGTARYTGSGKATIILRQVPNKALPGFGSVWEIVKLDEIKQVFSAQEIKLIQATPALKGLI